MAEANRFRRRTVLVALAVAASVAGACNPGNNGGAASAASTSLSRSALQCVGNGAPKPASPEIQAYIPQAVDGRQVGPSPQLGAQFGAANSCIDQLASGEIAPANGPSPMGVPAGFVAAMTTSQNVDDLTSTLVPKSLGPVKASQKKIDGKQVLVREFDLGKMANTPNPGQTPDSAAQSRPPLPALTIEAFTPDKHSMVFVLSSEGTAFADDIMKAAIAHGAGGQ